MSIPLFGYHLLVPETKDQGPAIKMHFLATLVNLTNQDLPSHLSPEFPFSL